MAISGDLSVSAALTSCIFSPPRASSQLPPSKVSCSVFFTSAQSSSLGDYKPSRYPIHCRAKRALTIFEDYNKPSRHPIRREFDNFLLNAIGLNFSQRLSLAWKILFSSSTTKRNDSNADIAKQRLKMILFSDRCAISEEAKQKIVTNVVSVLSEFVEIECQDKVQLTVSTDPDLGTIYSVTVPVRRVRSEYQMDDETGSITNVEYRDRGESSGSVDVKFEFYTPSE